MVTASRFSFLGQCRGSYVRRKKCGGKWYPDKKKKKRNNTQYRGGANRYAAHPTYQRERVLMAVIYLFCGCDQGEIFSNVFVLSDENRRRWQMAKTKASDAVRSCKGSRSGLEPKKGALESFGTANIAFNCERYRCAKFCLISPVTSVFFFRHRSSCASNPIYVNCFECKNNWLSYCRFVIAYDSRSNHEYGERGDMCDGEVLFLKNFLNPGESIDWLAFFDLDVEQPTFYDVLTFLNNFHLPATRANRIYGIWLRLEKPSNSA